MYFNPSMTGFMNSTFRVSTIYRNQWQTVSKGYNTFFSSFEFQPFTNRDNSKGIGLGIGFTSDVAGSLSYGQNDICLSMSYFFALDRRNHSFISMGLQVARTKWSMNLSNARFNRDNIYDDNIRYENNSTFDISCGFSYQNAIDDEHLFSIGAALFHINRPSISKFADAEEYLHRRFYGNVSYMMPCNKDRISINPQIVFQHQHNFNELLIGNEFLIDLDGAIFTKKIFSGGIFLRNLDAIVLMPKFRYNDFVAGIAYDVNISKLNKASKTYGAMELWLSYSFNIFASYNKQITKIPCPIF